MPLFMCAKCKCVDNTALTNYWTKDYDDDMNKLPDTQPALCSSCDPKIGHWHGQFEQHRADGLYIGEDGFLYGGMEDVRHTAIVGFIKNGEVLPVEK